MRENRIILIGGEGFNGDGLVWKDVKQELNGTGGMGGDSGRD